MYASKFTPTQEGGRVPEPAVATVAEASAHLQVSPSTVRRLLDSGALPKIKIRKAVRIPWSDIHSLAKAPKASR